MTKPPRVEDGVLLVRDLELDVWLSGDGATLLRLDEDEFAESGLEERDPEAAAMALRTMAEVEGLARSGELVGLLKW
jgi:predicted RNA-binding protein associated with RNAse of E/G family